VETQEGDENQEEGKMREMAISLHNEYMSILFTRSLAMNPMTFTIDSRALEPNANLVPRGVAHGPGSRLTSPQTR
jgi:hypothetical protein